MHMLDLWSEEFHMHLTHSSDEVMLCCNHICVRLKCLSWPTVGQTDRMNLKKMKTVRQKTRKYANRNSIHVFDTDVTETDTKSELVITKRERDRFRKLLNIKYGIHKKQIQFLPDTLCCW